MQPTKYSVLRRNVRDVYDRNCLSGDKPSAVVRVAATRCYKIVPRSLQHGMEILMAAVPKTFLTQNTC